MSRARGNGAGMFAMRTPSGHVYMLSAEEVARLAYFATGAYVDGRYVFTNVATRRSVVVTPRSLLTETKLRKIGIG